MRRRRMSGAVSPRRAALIAAGSDACRNGLRSPAMSRKDSSSGVAYCVGAPLAVRVVVVAAQRAARVDAPHERGHVGDRVLGRVATRAVGALLGQHARQVAVGVEQEGVGAVGADDRVEDQPVDVLGEGARVLQRDVGAVGDAHERDLVRAERLAQGVDVEHRVGGRVEGAPRPDAGRAVGDRLGRDRVQRAQPLQVGALQDARLPRPALVEHREAVAAQGGIQRDRERRGRRRPPTAPGRRTGRTGACAGPSRWTA